MCLSSQMTFSLVTAAVVWAIRESTSGLDPISDTLAARHLKLRAIVSDEGSKPEVLLTLETNLCVAVQIFCVTGLCLVADVALLLHGGMTVGL